MGGTRFVFTDEWLLPAVSPEAVAAVLTALEFYPEWWPDMRAVGRINGDQAMLLVRSRLPHTLELVVTAVSRDLPTLEVAMAGDLVGSVRWTLEAVSDGVRVQIRQDVEVPGVAGLVARIARPVLRWNHEQSMKRGHAGLMSRLRP